MQGLVDSRGQRIELGNRIGGGGEAEVFDVTGQASLVAKIYLAGKAYPLTKIQAMMALSDPQLRELCAWPSDVLLENKRFVGFMMPKIPTEFRPVFNVYNPQPRSQHFPGTDWRFLVEVAEHLAHAVATIHAAGVAIGDVNHANLLVAPDASVRCIDTDSFQITAGRQTWPCRVGTPDYQPPEMQGLSTYQGVVRTPNHDAFGLAVVLFRLLFAGRHPYSGRGQGRGDPPPIEEAIKQGCFAYTQSRNVKMLPPSDALPVAALPRALRDLFEQAFAACKGKSPPARPDAATWAAALHALGQELRCCRGNATHVYYAKAAACPWSAVEQGSGAVLFSPASAKRPPPAQSAGSLSPSQQPLSPAQLAQLLGMASPPPAPVTSATAHSAGAGTMVATAIAHATLACLRAGTGHPDAQELQAYRLGYRRPIPRVGGDSGQRKPVTTAGSRPGRACDLIYLAARHPSGK